MGSKWIPTGFASLHVDYLFAGESALQHLEARMLYTTCSATPFPKLKAVGFQTASLLNESFKSSACAAVPLTFFFTRSRHTSSNTACTAVVMACQRVARAWVAITPRASLCADKVRHRARSVLTTSGRRTRRNTRALDLP